MAFLVFVESSISAPHFARPLRSIDVPEGMSLVLECHVTGSPLPEICWYQDTKHIGNDSHEFEVNNNTGQSMLKIDCMTPEHSGNYVCLAKNIGGETITSASIRVVRKYCIVEYLKYNCAFKEVYDLLF